MEGNRRGFFPFQLDMQRFVDQANRFFTHLIFIFIKPLHFLVDQRRHIKAGFVLIDAELNMVRQGYDQIHIKRHFEIFLRDVNNSLRQLDDLKGYLFKQRKQLQITTYYRGPDDYVRPDVFMSKNKFKNGKISIDKIILQCIINKRICCQSLTIY